MTNEIWRPVVGYEGLYEVSDFGRVRNADRILKPHMGKRKVDYPRIELRSMNGPKKFMVHRLVAAAFLGRCPEGQECNHKNGCKADPSLANLEYVTRRENHLHSYRVLGQQKQTGSRHGMHKLIESQVIEIIDQASRGEPLQVIAQHFDVGVSTICQIARGRTWKHLPRPVQADRRLNYGKRDSNWHENKATQFTQGRRLACHQKSS